MLSVKSNIILKSTFTLITSFVYIRLCLQKYAKVITYDIIQLCPKEMVSSGLKLSLDNLLTYIDQKAALLDLLTQLKEEFPEATIHGHNEFSAKACPCFDVKKELDSYFEKGSGGNKINKGTFLVGYREYKSVVTRRLQSSFVATLIYSCMQEKLYHRTFGVGIQAYQRVIYWN